MLMLFCAVPLNSDRRPCVCVLGGDMYMLTPGWLDGYYRIVVRRKIFVELNKNWHFSKWVRRIWKEE
jgi:hypothetical protein